MLIATNPRDADSFLVEQALQLKGVRTELIHFSDFPSHRTTSLFLDSLDACRDSWRLQEVEAAETLLPDVMWWRRPGLPVLPDDVHPDDLDFINQETAKFISGVWYHLPTCVVPVNDPTRALIADRKPYQLRVAREIGFKVPPTLFSNDPIEIRDALRRWGGAGIYKAFGSEKNFWVDLERQKMLALFTTAVDEASLPADDVLSLTPGIYQPLLPKDYEVRVSVFGSTVFAVKIFSQDQQQSRVDWRNGQRRLRYESIELSPSLKDKCLLMLRHLGLLVGCFDLVVTPSAEVIFLEVNEGGQFLWLESSTGLPLLDAFSDFLIKPRPDFVWKPSAQPLRIEDVQALAHDEMERAEKNHMSPEPLARFEVPVEAKQGENGNDQNP